MFFGIVGLAMVTVSGLLALCMTASCGRVDEGGYLPVPGDVKGAMLRFDTPYRLHGRAPGSVPIGFGSVLRAGGTAENAVAEDRIGRAEGSVAGIRTSALLGLAAAWFGQQLQGNPEIIYAQT